MDTGDPERMASPALFEGIPEPDIEWINEWFRENPLYADRLLDLSGDSRDSTASEVEVTFGSLNTLIVNLQVPISHINRNESVRLEKAPPEVCVYSMDTLLGYLPPVLATPMIDVVDLARIDANIIDDIWDSPIEVPLKLTLYGRSSNKVTCEAILRSSGFHLDTTATVDVPDLEGLVQTFHPVGMVPPLVQPNYALSSLDQPVHVDDMALQSTVPLIHQAEPMDLSTRIDSTVPDLPDSVISWNNNFAPNLPSPDPPILPVPDLLDSVMSWNDNFAPTRPAPNVESHREMFTPDEMHSALDRLFDTLDEDDKTSMANATEAIDSELFDHQKQALHWMMFKENGDSLPPFWKETKSGKYCNTLLNHTVEERPHSIKGGILADDMGLGKTLQMISLIITNFYGSRPLAVPVPGRPRISRQQKSVEVHTNDDSEAENDEKPADGFEKIADIEEEIKKLDEKETSPSTPHTPQSPPDSEPKEKPPKKHPKLRFKADKSCIESQKEKSSNSVPSPLPVQEIKDGADANPLKRPRESASVLSPTKSPVKSLRKTIFIDDLPPISKKGKKVSTPKPCKYELWKRRKLSCDNSQDSSNSQSLDNTNNVSNSPVEQPSVQRGQSEDNESRTSSLSCVVRQSSEHSDEDGDVRLTDNQEECSEPMEKQTSTDQPCFINGNQVDVSLPKVAVISSDEDEELPDIMEAPHFDMEAFMSENHCDENGRTIQDGPRGTLIICPLSVLSNWQGQFEEHVHANVHLNIHNYYGSERCKDEEQLKQKDVVITTYGTLLSEFKAYIATGHSLLITTEWLRVVLDEGHQIRNPSAKQTKAVLSLKSERKWVLTGTPIQNKMLDLWSLIKFLDVQPLTEKYWWRSIMEKPLQRGKKIAFKRVQLLMGNIALRRTKNMQVNGRPLVDLPQRLVFIERIKMSDEESKLYKQMEDDGRSTIKKYVNRDKLLEKYILVLEIMLRLRQMCCHRCLLPEDRLPPDESDEEDDENEREKREMLQKKLQVIVESEEECSVCVDSLKKPVILPCSHYFCHPCILHSIRHKETEAKGSASCPLCRAPITEEAIIELPPEKSQEPQVYGEWNSSTKVDALMSALVRLRNEEPEIKSLVVSQFTSFLTLIENPLKEMGFQFVRLDGKMSSPQRSEMIRQFSQTGPGTPTVFLLSLRAGGVGLNLKAASRVFLMEPHWNPATEEQCFDRCHRLGQKRDVIITKFISEGTIEERMLDLQEKKRQLMNNSFKKKQSQEDRNRQRTQEIRDLMNIN